MKLYLCKSSILSCEAFKEFLSFVSSYSCSLSTYVEPSSQTLQPITLELRRRKIPKGGEVPSKRPRIEKNLCEYFFGIQLSRCLYI